MTLRRHNPGELLDRTLITNQRLASTVLGEHHYNGHRPHRTFGHAASLRPLPRWTTREANTVRRGGAGGLGGAPGTGYPPAVPAWHRPWLCRRSHAA